MTREELNLLRAVALGVAGLLIDAPPAVRERLRNVIVRCLDDLKSVLPEEVDDGVG